MPLTDAEIENYRRDGLVVPFPVSPVRRLAAAHRPALSGSCWQTTAIPTVSRPISFSARTWTVTRTYGARGNPEWLDIIRNPEILDLVEQLIGPDLVLWGVTIFGKPAGNGKATRHGTRTAIITRSNRWKR